MTLKPKDLVDFINKGEKNRQEISAIIDRVILSIEEEIDMIGNQRKAREDRHTKALAASLSECDERADFLIRRKDLMRDLKAKLAGEVEQISGELLQLPAPAPEKKRSLFGRQKEKIA